MIKKEFKENLKSFLLWTIVLVAMFTIVYLVYPIIITDETIITLDNLLKVLPKELLKTFNFDLASIATAYGWFKSEGFVFVLIMVGVYAATLGGTILLREENDKTIEYLNSLPIKRSDIVTSKVITGITYLVLVVLSLLAFNYICLLITSEMLLKEFLLLSITPIFIALPLFAMNMYMSTYMKKTNKTIVVSIGMVFVFYLLTTLVELTPKVSFLKYFTIYTLSDTRNVIQTLSINPNMVIISIIITLAFILLTYIKYDKKELL